MFPELASQSALNAEMSRRHSRIATAAVATRSALGGMPLVEITFFLLMIALVA